MYCASKYSKKRFFHNHNCFQCKKIKKQNKTWFYSKDDAKNNGYVLCPYCSYINKLYKEESYDILKFKYKTGYCVWYEQDAVYIKTPIATWKIVAEGCKHRPHLYHENANQIYRFRPLVNGKLDIRFHPQTDVYSANIIGYLNYIERHDCWRGGQEIEYKTMPRNTKKLRAKYKAAKLKSKKMAVRRVLNLIEKMEMEGLA